MAEGGGGGGGGRGGGTVETSFDTVLGTEWQYFTIPPRLINLQEETTGNRRFELQFNQRSLSYFSEALHSSCLVVEEVVRGVFPTKPMVVTA